MSNQFQRNPTKDNEASMRSFIDKLDGKDNASFGETGIKDAIEAFHSALSILRANNVNSTESAHSAQSIMRVAHTKSAETASASCCSKKQHEEKKKK